ncbi:hypothetical protein RUND412_001325 [Rhizina undulata]
MESSDNRRQSDSLPSIEYIGFERVAREGAQFHQRHPSITHNSLSTASPISPTTMFGPTPPPPPPFSQLSQSASNCYISPPESRRTSGENENQPPPQPPPQGRHSLPSLLEVIYDRIDKPFTAPSPLQTPPIGPGSFSSSTAPSSHMSSMPRSQPSDVHTNGQSHAPPQPPTPQAYPPPPPPPPVSHNPPGPPPASAHHHDSSYRRREPQEHTRSLPQNPYSQTQPPNSIPSIRPPEPYAPPPPNSASYQPHPYTPSRQGTSPQYPPTPSYSTPTGPPPTNGYPFPQHPASNQSQPPYHPQQQSYSYPPSHENIAPPQTSPGSKGGLKRPSNYGSAIERALTISSIRRDLEAIKEHSSRIYYLVKQYQDDAQSYPGSLESSLRDFDEALRRSYQNTEALKNCHGVFQELSSKEFAEQNAQEMNTAHAAEYGEDSHSYPDEARTNGAQQPDTKKIRRGN